MRNVLLSRTIAIDTLRFEPDVMHRFALEFARFRPKVLFGHSHSMYMLTLFLKKHGYAASSIKTIVSTSTVLTDTERQVMENFFQCRVFDRYGCEEVSLIASECERHEGFHINMDHLYVEFVADSIPVKENACGDIIVTDLTNFGMPFIRYRIEDAGTPTSRQCKCGRTLPLIEKVQGRVADFIVTPEGRLLSGVSVLDHFTATHMAIERVQIIQDRVNHLQFRIVRADDFTEKKFTVFRECIPQFFGPSMTADFEFVSEIPRERNGKYRFTISQIPHPFEEAAERTQSI
jgi:phenylacetate-CoA ligase